MATDLEIAWAGGLFEGEGCFQQKRRRQKHRKIYLGLSMRLTDEDVIRKFRGIVDAGNITGPHRPSGSKEHPHYKSVWSWDCSEITQIRLVVALLWPWLGSRRKVRALELISQDCRSHIRKFGESLSQKPDA